MLPSSVGRGYLGQPCNVGAAFAWQVAPGDVTQGADDLHVLVVGIAHYDGCERQRAAVDAHGGSHAKGRAPAVYLRRPGVAAMVPQSHYVAASLDAAVELYGQRRTMQREKASFGGAKDFAAQRDL